MKIRDVEGKKNRVGEQIIEKVDDEQQLGGINQR